MNKRIMAYASISLLLSYSLTACGGGGSSSSDVGLAGKPGFSVPTEISAVPTNTAATASKPSAKAGLKSKLLAVKEAATDADTDYSKAKTMKFVNEHALEQFDIIEQVLSALAQTNYADVANINKGPYKAMVAFQDEKGGVQTKSLEPWVVDSTLIVENGKEVNKVQFWIEQPGAPSVLKGEFKIFQSATRRADGSYSDYGVWTLNVKFDETGEMFFAASADIDANGRAVIKIHEKSQDGGGGGGPSLREKKAIMNRAEAAGFGQVEFPEDCQQGPCTPVTVTAKYAYNANHVALQKGSGSVEYKDRNVVTEMTRRYGMFDSATGVDVLKSKSFGFPVEFTDANGTRQFAYYGAWQGRHSLWANGEGSVPENTTVTRQDRNSQQAAETYKVSKPFVGTLTKRTAVTASINDIKGIPVETWINSNFELKYRAAGPAGAKWYECTQSVDPNGNFQPPVCDTEFTAFDSLLVGANDNRKFVNINRWDQVNNQPINYVFVGPAGASGSGFFLGAFDPSNGRTTATSTAYAPADNDSLWVNVSGSIYIEYNGTGFVEKSLLSFDQQTWTPEFDPEGDKPYVLPLDREFYINSRGANYIVKRTGASSYNVKIEIQTSANPINAATFVPAGTVFKSSWSPETNSTFTFVTDSASPNFMKLVYNTIGSNEPTPAPNVGEVATKGQWGLFSYVGGVKTENQFNWDYPREGGTFGSQQYLMDASNNYVLLSDPVRLLPVALTNNLDEEKTFSLQYDGWMQGLPDLFFELSKNNFVMTNNISDKIVSIPAGTVVTDADDQTKSYLIKPLEVSQFLKVLGSAPAGIDITAADSVDLGTVPNFVEHNMGAMPVTTGVKYSEGKLVE